MKYIMKCHRCKTIMKYIKDDEMENMGFITMDCPKGCDNSHLIPKNNPNLIKIKED